MKPRQATKAEVKKATKKTIKRYGNVLKTLAKYDQVGNMDEARRLVNEDNYVELKKTKKTPYEDMFLDQLIEEDILSPVREFMAIEGRRFRLDFAWPSFKIGVEIHGNVWHGGRHTSGAGFSKDREKMNLHVIEGWRIIEATTGQVKDGQAIKWVSALFDKRQFT